jgi:hypothetical protein
VDLTENPQMTDFKLEHGVPSGAESCHTALVDGYVVEGHVPVGALIRLLEDRPEGIGLALPGMPADAAGMTDDSASFESQPVMLIGSDGTLTSFDY